MPGVESKIRVSRLMVLTTRPPGAVLRLLGCLVRDSGICRAANEPSANFSQSRRRPLPRGRPEIGTLVGRRFQPGEGPSWDLLRDCENLVRLQLCEYVKHLHDASCGSGEAPQYS